MHQNYTYNVICAYSIYVTESYSDQIFEKQPCSCTKNATSSQFCVAIAPLAALTQQKLPL